MGFPAIKMLKPAVVGLGAILLVVIAGGLQAEELYNSWYWHAFASQGLVYTSDNNFAGDSDDSISTELRELGLILGGEPLQDLTVAAQFISRKMGAMDEGKVHLDYAFASYMLYSDWERSVGIKAGRVRSPVGFFNETRDVAHTRQSILLPQSTYWDRMRNLMFARDGVQLFGAYQLGLSTLSWDLVYGRTQIRDEERSEVVGMDVPGDGRAQFLPIARVIWDWDAGRVRLGATYHPIEYEYDAAAVDILSDGTIELDTWIISAEYNAAKWSLLGEYSVAKSHLDSLLDKVRPGQSFAADIDSYYLQGTYRFTSRWDGFLRYDRQQMRFDEEGLSVFDNAVKDVTVGVAWRPSERWLLRGEWHFIDGTSWLSVRENQREDAKRHWQMALFQVSYRI